MHATREVCSVNTSRFLPTSRATISTTVERYLYSSHCSRHSPQTVNQDLFPHGATAQPIAQWPFFLALATGGLLKLRFRCPLSLAFFGAPRNESSGAEMRGRPASPLARCGGNRARSRSLLGALATCFATRSLWCGCRQPAFACATLDMAEGGAQRSLSSRDGSRSSCRVALPPCEAGGSGLRCKHGRPSKSKLGTQCEPESRHHQR
jgi:hypothetical protein